MFKTLTNLSLVLLVSVLNINALPAQAESQSSSMTQTKLASLNLKLRKESKLETLVYKAMEEAKAGNFESAVDTFAAAGNLIPSK